MPSPRWHLIEGEAGCRYAADHQCACVIVDALRASATAAMLLHAGAAEIRAVDSVEAARSLRAALPEALLVGERGGLPPDGFDAGNSPRGCDIAAGRTVVFTTTTGTARLFQARGAAAVYMGSVTNASSIADTLGGLDNDVVLVPAGLSSDPDVDAAEDWTAAAAIALWAGVDMGEGALEFRERCAALELDSLEHIFRESRHGQKLIELGLEEDVIACARPNLTAALPQIAEYQDGVAILRNAQAA
jgi:2-phosphosulfolactate phosphatase